MNEHLDDEDVVHTRSERELTLSTGAILGIFFALVLLCGLCFGVGYNMGHKAVPTPLALNENGNETLAADPNSSKPAAGSALDSSTTAAPAVVAPAPVAPKPAPIVRKPPPPAADPDATIVTAETATSHTPEPSAAPAVRSVSPSALMPGATGQGTGSIMVQVAAVSHQEDADLLVGALRSRGYVVSARQGASDGFIHVQVGPFRDKQSAEAMRQRLISDGYNAILK